MGYQYHSAELDSVLKALGGGSTVSQPAPPTPSGDGYQHGLQLAQLLQKSQQNGSALQQDLQTEQHRNRREAEELDHDDYDPTSFVPSAKRLHENNEPNLTKPDPQTIISWKPALRHVTRLVSTEAAVQQRARRMYCAQRDHESQWWKGREALIKQQAARGEGRKKLGELLRNVGGAVDPSISGPTLEEEEEELRRYDLKVYNAYSTMQKDYQNQLAAMGIPFFNTRASLVVNDEEEESTAGSSVHERAANTAKDTITKSELTKLRMRMIDLLEDLCSD